MTGPRKFSANPGRAKSAERRERYIELRREGMDAWDAAVEVGIDPFNTGPMYERWFQAAEKERES